LVGALLILQVVAMNALGAKPHVVVIAETEKAPQAETVAAMRKEVQTDGIELEVLAPSGTSQAALAGATLIITVGSLAAQAAVALDATSPLLHVLLSRSTLDTLPHKPGSAPWSAILLDQPAERQIALIRLALPDHQRIATIAGPETPALASALTGAAERRGLDTRSTTVDDIPSLYPALRSVLEQPAVLIITPDSQVFNSQTVHHVLLTAFRLRAPVLGFSAAYVRAGAVLGLYTTPAQAGTETAAIVRRVVAGQALPPVAHHTLFEVGVNPTVARSLGIQLPQADTLTGALQSREGRLP
jgi:ABC-type uncharacterized transport system substrate-binding protein